MMKNRYCVSGSRAEITARAVVVVALVVCFACPHGGGGLYSPPPPAAGLLLLRRPTPPRPPQLAPALPPGHLCPRRRRLRRRSGPRCRRLPPSAGQAGPVSEQVMVLQNIGSSVLVSENQLSDLHQILTEAAKLLNTDAPDLYIRQNPVPNAYTLAISGKKPFIVVHTSLVELLTRKELQAVLAHELGHLKCDHGVWLTFANILTMGAYSVPGFGMVAGFLEEQLYRWLRAAELTCDRAALLVVQDPKVVISVLMKLAGGCPSLADQLNVDAFLEQARSYDKAASNPVGWYIRNAQTRELSHPLPVMRAREIDEWSRSREYRTVQHKVIQLNEQDAT